MGSICPRRNNVICPVLDDTTSDMQFAISEIEYAAACLAPSPPGS